MKNNLTKKEIDNLLKWAKEYEIEDLNSEEKILNVKELEIKSIDCYYLLKELIKR